MLQCVCVCVCVCAGSYTILSFGREGTPKFGVMLRECIALNNYGGLGVRSPVVVDFFFNRCSEINSEAFWRY